MISIKKILLYIYNNNFMKESSTMPWIDDDFKKTELFKFTVQIWHIRD